MLSFSLHQSFTSVLDVFNSAKWFKIASLCLSCLWMTLNIVCHYPVDVEEIFNTFPSPIFFLFSSTHYLSFYCDSSHTLFQRVDLYTLCVTWHVPGQSGRHLCHISISCWLYGLPLLPFITCYLKSQWDSCMWHISQVEIMLSNTKKVERNAHRMV